MKQTEINRSELFRIWIDTVTPYLSVRPGLLGKEEYQHVWGKLFADWFKMPRERALRMVTAARDHNAFEEVQDVRRDWFNPSKVTSPILRLVDPNRWRPPLDEKPLVPEPLVEAFGIRLPEGFIHPTPPLHPEDHAPIDES